MSQYYFGGQVTHGFEAYHVGEAYSTVRGYVTPPLVSRACVDTRE